MFRPASCGLLLLALLGACEAPQPATTVGPLPGQQTERFANGDRYVGQMAGGLREGRGTYTWSDGRRYVGSFRAGLQDGQGTYTYPNGEKYEGQFQANRRTGQGTYSWPDGRKYVGEFRDDRPDGRGIYTWPDGKKYVGEFKLGAASGQGTYTWPDGRKYVGELRDDQPNGQGTFTFADGRRQTGLFRNGEYVGAQGGASGDPNLVRVGASPGAGPSGAEVPLQRRGGTYIVAAEINGQAPLDFHIDSGAADVSVPAYLFQQMKSAGSVRAEDMLGTETYVLGNGTSIKAETFRIRTLKVGSVVVRDVRANVSQYAGPPLLGMSFLGRFNSWSVDNGRGVLILR
jgi:clan AA aspartic protease (TIGR02281 family)